MRTKHPNKTKAQFQSMWISTADKLPPDKDIQIIIWNRYNFVPHIVGSKNIRQGLEKAIRAQKEQGNNNHKHFVSYWMYYHPPAEVMPVPLDKIEKSKQGVRGYYACYSDSLTKKGK